jgi:hypothetical protein
LAQGETPEAEVNVIGHLKTPEEARRMDRVDLEQISIREF